MTSARPPLISRARFISDLQAAVTAGAAFAAGKLGFSEQHWLGYPVFLATHPGPRRVRAYELALRHHFERQSGVFPADPDFAREFVAGYARDAREMDCLGLFGAEAEGAIIRHHRLAGRLLAYQDMEPDRSSPADEGACYLPLFRGLRLLLVAPFAALLRERADRATFERVWSRTGKPWFEPATVAAVEFPYGFDPETQARFGTALALRDFIASRIDATEFDVALVAAGGLGIPLAAHIRRSGRIALSLGGHLQVLFGVIGARWRSNPEWRERYFNDSWIDMPERYRPKDWESLVDGGAYW